MLTKEQILNVDDLPVEVVKVPEWGGTVRIQTMNGTERDSFEASIMKKGGGVNMVNLRAKLCALTMVGDDGKRYFADSEVVELGKKSAAALDRIFTVAQRLNGFGKSDIEDLAKNSEAIQPDDSISS